MTKEKEIISKIVKTLLERIKNGIYKEIGFHKPGGHYVIVRRIERNTEK